METTSDTLMLNRAHVRMKSRLREYIEAILWAVFLVMAVRTCVVQPFKIPSGSMENTMLVGDHLFVNKFIYGIRVPFTNLRLPSIREPERGDVLVFKYPQDRSKDFIKRVIGVPGDVVLIRDKQIFVNNKPYINLHEINKEGNILPAGSSPRDNFGPIRVPYNSYFVMGDNRDNSYDSRFWGFVEKTDVVGLAILKYWSWDSDRWRVRWDRIGRPID